MEKTIKLYIANLGKYIEGELVGEWFDLPCDMNEVANVIGLNNQYEEYAIHDYEAPFKIGEYDSIDKLNEIQESININVDAELFPFIETIAEQWFNGDILEMCESMDDITVYIDCMTIEDVAYVIVENSGMLDSCSDEIKRYFDYSAFGRDIEIEGNFLYLPFEYSGGQWGKSYGGFYVEYIW